MSIQAGQYIQDGSVRWIIVDTRDNCPVGGVRALVYLPDGYIKANGAEVNKEDYPRLVTLADHYDLWTSDHSINPGLFGKGSTSDTMTLPDYTERTIQFTDMCIGSKRDAGLPQISGSFHSSSGGGSVYNDGAFHANLWAMVSYGNWGSGHSNATYVDFNASWSNPIYGNSATVQPPAINVIPCLKY